MKLFYAIDQDAEVGFWDSTITRDELSAYFQAQDGMTEAEVQASVDEMFLKYNEGEADGTSDDLIGKNEMWIKYHYEKQLIEERRR